MLFSPFSLDCFYHLNSLFFMCSRHGKITLHGSYPEPVSTQDIPLNLSSSSVNLVINFINIHHYMKSLFHFRCLHSMVLVWWLIVIRYFSLVVSSSNQLIDNKFIEGNITKSSETQKVQCLLQAQFFIVPYQLAFNAFM